MRRHEAAPRGDGAADRPRAASGDRSRLGSPRHRERTHGRGALRGRQRSAARRGGARGGVPPVARERALPAGHARVQSRRQQRRAVSARRGVSRRRCTRGSVGRELLALARRADAGQQCSRCPGRLHIVERFDAATVAIGRSTEHARRRVSCARIARPPRRPLRGGRGPPTCGARSLRATPRTAARSRR